MKMAMICMAATLAGCAMPSVDPAIVPPALLDVQVASGRWNACSTTMKVGRDESKRTLSAQAIDFVADTSHDPHGRSTARCILTLRLAGSTAKGRRLEFSFSGRQAMTVGADLRYQFELGSAYRLHEHPPGVPAPASPNGAWTSNIIAFVPAREGEIKVVIRANAIAIARGSQAQWLLDEMKVSLLDEEPPEKL